LSKTTLWPVNHELIDVGLNFSSCDAVDPNPATSISVTSDEPVDEDTGDGVSSPDAKFIKETAGNIVGLRLRAERSENGDGRVYLVKIIVKDKFGNSASKCAAVTVPYDQSSASQASVAGQAAVAAAACAPLANSVLGPPPDGPAPVIGP